MRAFLGVKGLWLVGLIGPNKANKIVLNSLGDFGLIGLIGPNKANKIVLNGLGAIWLIRLISPK